MLGVAMPKVAILQADSQDVLLVSLRGGLHPETDWWRYDAETKSDLLPLIMLNACCNDCD
jgi:hypothetical protein